MTRFTARRHTRSIKMDSEYLYKTGIKFGRMTPNSAWEARMSLRGGDLMAITMGRTMISRLCLLGTRHIRMSRKGVEETRSLGFLYQSFTTMATSERALVGCMSSKAW